LRQEGCDLIRLPPQCRWFMDKGFEYVDYPNMSYLMKGLTFRLPRCAKILDNLLVQFNKETQIPDRIVSWNGEDLSSRSPLHFEGRGRLIVEISELMTKKGRLHVVQLLESNAEKESAPDIKRFHKIIHRNTLRMAGCRMPERH
jgi:hypothetical protein